VLKLAVFPALVVAIATGAFGLSGGTAVSGAVRGGADGHERLSARPQLGGDAELYAVVTTTQTALAFFTIPAVLALTAQISG
jgi:malonate transporter and related proteins